MNEIAIFRNLKIKPVILVLIAIAVIKLLLHLFTAQGAQGYGYFRDELYNISAASRLSFGYVDIPPLVPLIMAVNKAILGTSLFAIHILPAVIGAVTVFMGGMLALELGGNFTAAVLSSVIFLAAPHLTAVDSIFTYDSFDLLLCAVFFFYLIKFLKTEDKNYWLIIGLISGLGLLIKLSIIFYGFAMTAALLATGKRKILASKKLWIGGIICLAFISPFIIWQALHGFPIKDYWVNYALNKTFHASPLQFLLMNFMTLNLTCLPILAAGLAVLLFWKPLKPYRTLGLMFIILFIVFIIMRMKYYLLIAMFFPLIASGSVYFEHLMAKISVKWISAGTSIIYSCILILSGIIFIPYDVPVLSPQDFINYSSHITRSNVRIERNELGALPQIFADRLGWEDLAKTVSMVYLGLPPEDRKKCMVFAQNYGEAGAIDLYKSKYSLPGIICGHLSWYFWRPADINPDVIMIVIGGKEDDHKRSFGSVEKMSVFPNPYVVPFESKLPIWVCRDLKIPVSEIWGRIKHYD